MIWRLLLTCLYCACLGRARRTSSPGILDAIGAGLRDLSDHLKPAFMRKRSKDGPGLAPAPGVFAAGAQPAVGGDGSAGAGPAGAQLISAGSVDSEVGGYTMLGRSHSPEMQTVLMAERPVQVHDDKDRPSSRISVVSGSQTPFFTPSHSPASATYAAVSPTKALSPQLTPQQQKPAPGK